MNYWILPSNEDSFKLSDLLKDHSFVDWKQHNNFEVGDVIYIYNSRPWHYITHEMRVEQIDMNSAQIADQKEYWTDMQEYKNGLKKNRFVRLRLIRRAPNPENVTYDILQKNGLIGHLQGAQKIEGNLLSFIQGEFAQDTNERIARVCWNTNGWERPSGREGKSSNDSYEAEKGFGHEEWLLDRTKICDDGYHYAFLEPLRRSAFEGYKDIHIYTYTPDKKRLYVGCIKDAEYVSPGKAEEIWKQYVSRGWDKSMIKDLDRCGISFVNPPFERLNVRFKFEKFVDYTAQRLFISSFDTNITTPRYSFLNKRGPLLFEIIDPSTVDDDSESILDPNQQIPEGAKSRVIVNRYERSQEARKQCLSVKGYKCVVCGMDFEEMYGELGKGFMHVHHIKPISEIGQKYEVNPINDLVPVCPNCHAMLHRGKDGKVLTVDELKDIIKSVRH